MQEFSKSEKKRLRELAALAYERDLGESLSKIALKVDEWRNGSITAVQLNEALHEYHQREARNVWSRYQTDQYDIQVAGAVVRGLLTETELGKEVIATLSNQIKFFRSEAEKDQ